MSTYKAELLLQSNELRPLILHFHCVVTCDFGRCVCFERLKLSVELLLFVCNDRKGVRSSLETSTNELELFPFFLFTKLTRKYMLIHATQCLAGAKRLKFTVYFVCCFFSQFWIKKFHVSQSWQFHFLLLRGFHFLFVFLRKCSVSVLLSFSTSVGLF